MKNKLRNNKDPKHLLKASSLMNAIFVCVIISVFSGCFILISHYQSVLNNRLYLQEDLISKNESAFNYFLNNNEWVSYDEIKEITVFDDDDISSFIEKKNWGFYDILICKTVFKNDTIHKTALVGSIKKEVDDLALYVTDYDKPLKLSGKTKVLGDIKIPNGRSEQAYINGQKGNALTLRGRQLKSKDKLPKIDKTIKMDVLGLPRISFNNINEETILINGFNNVTKVLDLNGIASLKDITCKGNFILYSINDLEIDSSVILNDVVIIAPVVKIISGFKGNVQIIATKEVIVEENVSLMYPSSIYIKNDTDIVSVEIKKNSTLIGGIVIDGNTYSNSLDRKLFINENTTIIGNVYCYGSTQLNGNIIGSIYTDRFFLKTEASNYENVILNASINKEKLSDNFVELPLFNNSLDKKTYAVIKEF
ncbi:hypothetical protein [Flavivirga rizhaonensis]|uniref:Polymer-forming cytoskeletal protein n=1 Tax=Flavivirga rizhaonensis TaxID=2559571 RepID=A0A4V3P4D9_9FLAO|nr:hypothetical protein [Flavivirga rizhaonensis]TGV01054.1 hypothetical protein EM932_16985 [Flavivirga rizhaonensis]